MATASIAKRELSDLALFGGAPLSAEPLHVGRPNLPPREALLARLEEILDRRWLTNRGPCVVELEERIAAYTGVQHCISMCNGTIALEIAIRALGMTGEVIVPSFTFIATAHALQWQEVTPVFCDIDPDTHTLDPKQIEKHITPRTTGIIGVHLWGRACEVDALEGIAREHGLKLIFDAAHAFGCTYRGKMVGSFGDAEVLSFHATKYFNTFEGGAVLTNDEALASKVRLMQNFGFAGEDNVIYIGTNGKMSEISAAMGLTSLDYLHEFVEVNRRNYALYAKYLSGIRGLRLMPYADDEQSNYQYIVVQIDGMQAGLTRDEVQQVLLAENVRARRYFFPGCHRMEPYRSYFPHAGLLLPETERISGETLLLPTGTAVGEPEIAAICAAIRTALANGVDVRAKLSQR